MLLNNFFDDREAEAGAARARRHIGLDEALTVSGQSNAAVAHRDPHFRADLRDGYRDRSTIAFLFNRFDGILHKICQRLPELAPIADHRWGDIGHVEFEGDRRMRDFMEEQRLTHDIDERFLTEHRLGHPRER